MTDGHALLAASRERQADDTPHLVYADWADDNGMSAAAHHIREVVERERSRKGWDEGRTRSMRMLPQVGGEAVHRWVEVTPSGDTSIVHLYHSGGVAAPMFPNHHHAHIWWARFPAVEAAERVRSLVAEGHHPVGAHARAAAGI